MHAVNLLVFFASLAAFDFFLRELLRYRRETGVVGAPAWVVTTVGYVIFLWSSLNLIGTAFVAPDFAVATCAYLAAGLVLRCRREPHGLVPWAALGIALGMGYLAKAPMFPLGLVFLLLAAVPRPRRITLRNLLSRAGLALAVFLLVASVHVAGLYATKGRLTLGDSAWLNYLWHVNRVPVLHYQGGRPGIGTPQHPTRVIYDDPAAYEFAGPVVATYPPWFDPAYWYRGLRPRPDPKGHVITARWSLRLYGGERALHHWLPSGVLLLLVAAYLVRRRWWSREALARHAVLWAAGVTALAMYAVIHLESRYIAPFMTFLWLGVVTGVRLPAGRQVIRGAGIVLVAVLMVHAALVLIVTTRGPARSAVSRSHTRRRARWTPTGGLPRPFGRWTCGRAIASPLSVPVSARTGRGSGDCASWQKYRPGRSTSSGRPTRRHGRRSLIGSPPPVPRSWSTRSAPAPRPAASPSTHEAMGWQRIGGTDYYARILAR